MAKMTFLVFVVLTLLAELSALGGVDNDQVTDCFPPKIISDIQLATKASVYEPFDQNNEGHSKRHLEGEEVFALVIGDRHRGVFFKLKAAELTPRELEKTKNAICSKATYENSQGGGGIFEGRAYWIKLEGPTDSLWIRVFETSARFQIYLESGLQSTSDQVSRSSQSWTEFISAVAKKLGIRTS